MRSPAYEAGEDDRTPLLRYDDYSLADARFAVKSRSLVTIQADNRFMRTIRVPCATGLCQRLLPLFKATHNSGYCSERYVWTCAGEFLHSSINSSITYSKGLLYYRPIPHSEGLI